MAGGQRGGGDGERAGWVGDGTADVGPGGVQAEKDGTGVFEEALAGRGRDHGTAVEKRRTEVVFEGGDVLGDGRLGVAEAGRGGGERTALGDRDEGPQQVRIHVDQYRLSTVQRSSLALMLVERTG